MIAEYEKMYRSLTQDGNIDKAIDNENQKIEKFLKQKNKLLELVAEDNISNSDFKSMTEHCNAEIKHAQEEIIRLEDQIKSNKEFSDHMNKIKAALRAAEADVSNGTVSREFIDGFIDKIFVTPETPDSMKLDIKIFTGDSTSEYIGKLNSKSKRKAIFNDDSEVSEDGCAGHTFKKMIEAYERNMK